MRLHCRLLSAILLIDIAQADTEASQVREKWEQEVPIFQSKISVKILRIFSSNFHIARVEKVIILKLTHTIHLSA